MSTTCRASFLWHQNMQKRNVYFVELLEQISLSLPLNIPLRNRWAPQTRSFMGTTLIQDIQEKPYIGAVEILETLVIKSPWNCSINHRYYSVALWPRTSVRHARLHWLESVPFTFNKTQTRNAHYPHLYTIEEPYRCQVKSPATSRPISICTALIDSVSYRNEKEFTVTQSFDRRIFCTQRGGKCCNVTFSHSYALT
jgi:hypothetical protein